jgi:hypothetical protein
MRRKEKLEKGNGDKENDLSIEENQPMTSSHNQPQSLMNDRYSNGTSMLNDVKDHAECSVFSVDTGVDNLTFNHSTTRINTIDENPHLTSKKSKVTAEYVPSGQNVVPKRAKSQDANFRRKRNLDHLSTECLAIKKMMRRHSYEIAVCENSWLPKEPPCFAPSQSSLNTYRYGVNNCNSVKTSQVGFENKAFDKFDYKKT